MREKDDLRAYLEETPVFVRNDDAIIVYWTAGAQRLFGFSSGQALGANAHELLRTVFPQPLQAIRRQVQTLGVWEGELKHTRADGAVMWNHSVWRRRASKLHGPIIVEVNANITERVRAEQQRDALAQELNHRVKNTLSVVQGIARMSFPRSEQHAVSMFEERLLAIAQAHDLLVGRGWTDADLAELVHRTVQTFHMEARVTTNGPDARLRPAAAVAYSLALFELFTNAMKHGALSVSTGHVDIAWTLLAGGERVHFRWAEHGGPRVERPSREGFGSRLLQRVLAAELGGPVQLQFPSEGVVCEFDGPLQKTPQADLYAPPLG